MTEQELNQKIKGAFDRAAPDVLEAVRSQCVEQKGTIILMKQPNKKKNIWTRFATVAAALVLVFGLGAGLGTYRASHAVTSTVSLDVNPSIEIKVNRREQVLEVTPRNEDAKIVIGTMDFKGSGLDVTVNALIGSMLRNGYLNELANSILVSVDDSDATRGKQLEEKLAGEIDALLHTGTFDGSVLSQTITTDDQLQTLADQYGITTGKAQLIQQIVTQDTRYTFESLVPLSINELNLISESGSLQLEQVSSTGTASDKAYVGRNGAKAAALTYAGIPESDVLRWECELDFEDGRIIYELEFHTSSGEYDCHVNALTGEVIKSHHEGDDRHDNTHHSGTSTSTDPVTSYVDADTAKAAALTHAGVNEADAYGWEVEFDEDDGRFLYEIEFHAGGYEYHYDVSALDGSIVKYERDLELDGVFDDVWDDRYDDRYDDGMAPTTSPLPTTTPSPAPTNSPTTSFITADQARAAALAHAGVSEADAYGWEVEFDKDDGRNLYEIEFRAGRYEYKYDIDAYTGAVLKSEKDWDD